MKTNIIVTGGAGYIGSHICKELKKSNFNPITYDNLSSGNERFVKWGPLIKGSILDKKKLLLTFKKYKPIAVIHLAAKSVVHELEKNQKDCFEVNVNGTINLLEAMTISGINKIIFSSTASVYGQNKKKSFKETHDLLPVNNYGISKLICEEIIKNYSLNKSLNYVILRYFNACGADNDLEIGELKRPISHLIPTIANNILKNQSSKIFGTDYSTFDGTCVRDYIHINDLAEAHIIILIKLLKSNFSDVYNLGAEKGYSVLNIIKEFENILGKKVKIKKTHKRDGDPSILIANAKKFYNKFNWKPKYSNINNIVKTEYFWREKINSSL